MNLGPDSNRSVLDSPAPTIQTVAYSLIISGVVVMFLYFGREILIPLALASLLSFVLWPLITVLRKAHVGRATSVIAAVALTIAGLVALGAVMAAQVTDLASELPRYEANLRGKVRALKGASMPSGAMEKAADAIQGLQEELKKDNTGQVTPTSPGQSTTTPSATPLPAGTTPIPVIVELHEPAPTVLQTYQDLVRPLLAPLTTLALVVLFLIFILMQREDLRDRILRLAGGADLQRSTVAMNDAADRLSRFFLTQLALNSAFGVFIWAGLALIGVPSPVLWGMLAALMRFVPYVGSIVAAIFPLALAAAVDPSWSMVLSAAALFLIAEPVAGQVLEPMLYGKNTGLSPVAVVVSALFWTLMWGPVGLLLATPLTVCLVVLGKHVPALGFLNVVLGDEPALAPPQRLYQRLLTGDSAEAAALAEQDVETLGLTHYYSNVAMQALNMAHLDAVKGRLDRNAQSDLLQTVQDMTIDLADYTLSPPPVAIREISDVASPNSVTSDGSAEPAPPSISIPVFCVATRSALDESVASLQSQLLTKHGLTSEVIGRAAAAQLDGSAFKTAGTVVCLSYFGSNSPVHVRSLIRRLKRAGPNIQIVAGFWMLSDDPAKVIEWQKSVGADFATASLARSVELCLAAVSARVNADTQSKPSTQVA